MKTLRLLVGAKVLALAVGQVEALSLIMRLNLGIRGLFNLY